MVTCQCFPGYTVANHSACLMLWRHVVVGSMMYCHLHYLKVQRHLAIFTTEQSRPSESYFACPCLPFMSSIVNFALHKIMPLYPYSNRITDFEYLKRLRS